jgi:hypothetical protein
MAESDSKKETVRIAIPPQPMAAPAEMALATPGTVRINLPTRAPALPSTASPESVPKADAPAPRPTLPRQVTPRPAARAATLGATGPGAASTAPLTATSPTNAGTPKKETARINVLRDPDSRSSGQMNKTQPLIDRPAAGLPQSPPTVAPEIGMAIDQIPKPLCWTILGVSATILIIQIWSYFS